MRARNIETRERRLGTWVDWDKTVHTFKAGDPLVTPSEKARPGESGSGRLQ